MSQNARRYTRPEIEQMVASSDKAAMRAVCALFRQQTFDERQTADTKHDNKRGFSQAHASIGTELATWMTGGKLDGVFRRRTGGKVAWKLNETSSRRKWAARQSAFAGRERVAVCRELALRYAGQLTKIANGEL